MKTNKNNGIIFPKPFSIKADKNFIDHRNNVDRDG